MIEHIAYIMDGASLVKISSYATVPSVCFLSLKFSVMLDIILVVPYHVIITIILVLPCRVVIVS